MNIELITRITINNAELVLESATEIGRINGRDAHWSPQTIEQAVEELERFKDGDPESNGYTVVDSSARRSELAGDEAAIDKLHRLADQQQPGLPVLQSWEMMQIEARLNGFTARLELNSDHEQDVFTSPFIIRYVDGKGARTSVTTLLYANSKLETAVDGRRCSIHISNDSESQRSYLRAAFREYEQAISVGA